MSRHTRIRRVGRTLPSGRKIIQRPAGTWTARPPSRTTGATSSTTLTVTIHGANDAPTLAVQTGSQNATVGSAFSLVLPAGTFTDVDAGDSLAYTATAANGSALPAWLSFNAATSTFGGTPASGDSKK